MRIVKVLELAPLLFTVQNTHHVLSHNLFPHTTLLKDGTHKNTNEISSKS